MAPLVIHSFLRSIRLTTWTRPASPRLGQAVAFAGGALKQPAPLATAVPERLRSV